MSALRNLSCLLVALCLLAACGQEAKPRYDLAKLTLTDLDGNPANLAGFDDKTLIVNFWASWCAPCVEELPALEAMQTQLDPGQYQVLLVSVDADAEQARQRLAELHIQLPSYRDGDMSLANGVFEIQGYPETLVLLPNGELHGRFLGARAWDNPDIRKKILP